MVTTRPLTTSAVTSGTRGATAPDPIASAPVPLDPGGAGCAHDDGATLCAAGDAVRRLPRVGPDRPPSTSPAPCGSSRLHRQVRAAPWEAALSRGTCLDPAGRDAPTPS